MSRSPGSFRRAFASRQEGKLFTVILRDVTERVQAQRELAALSAEASEVREQEKARIARELHDELAQSLDAVAATRRIAADLRPLVLDDLGLVPAMEWLVRTFSERHGTACELEVDHELELGEPYATAIFRIAQECLANVAKHARAGKVRVRLAATSSYIHLEVVDDGVGFYTGMPTKPTSLGLVGVRERAKLLRGSVAIKSAPGAGTQVEAKIPIEAG